MSILTGKFNDEAINCRKLRRIPQRTWNCKEVNPQRIYQADHWKFVRRAMMELKQKQR